MRNKIYFWFGLILLILALVAYILIPKSQTRQFTELNKYDKYRVNEIKNSFLKDLENSHYYNVFKLKGRDLKIIKLPNEQMDSEAFFFVEKDTPKIVVKSNSLHYEYYSDILKHEFCHYLDHLYSNYSSKNNVRIKYVNDLILLGKMKEYNSFISQEIRDKFGIQSSDDGYIEFINSLPYLSSNSEVYSRYIMFKIFLKKKKLIQNLDSNIDDQLINKYFKETKWIDIYNEDPSVIDFLLIVKRDENNKIKLS